MKIDTPSNTAVNASIFIYYLQVVVLVLLVEESSLSIFPSV